MWNSLKRAYVQFTSEKPGERFLRTHERWQRKATPALKVVIVVVGVVLAVAGFVLGFIPGVPGIILGVFGLALIGTCFRKVATGMDRAEIKLRQLKQRWFKRSTKGQSPTVSGTAEPPTAPRRA